MSNYTVKGDVKDSRFAKQVTRPTEQELEQLKKDYPEFRETVFVIDADRNRYDWKFEVRYRNHYMEFSLCDDNGQGLDRAKPNSDAQKRALDIRREYHIKQITPELYEEINHLIDILKDEYDSAIDDGMLSKDEMIEKGYNKKQIALSLMLDLTEDEIPDMNEDETYVTIGQRDYIIGDDDECERLHRESIESYADDLLLGIIRNVDSWICPYITLDIDAMCNDISRAQELGRYDGGEDYLELDGEYFYLYRTN